MNEMFYISGTTGEFRSKKACLPSGILESVHRDSYPQIILQSISTVIGKKGQ